MDNFVGASQRGELFRALLEEYGCALGNVLQRHGERPPDGQPRRGWVV